MSSKICHRIKGNHEFFRLMYGETDLYNMYELNVALLRSKEYTLSDLENMIPFERTVYIDLRNMLIKNEKQEN